MMEQDMIPAIETRLKRLERRQRLFQVVSTLSAVTLAGVTCFALRPRGVQAEDSAKVLRIRGLIIEDEQGQERILIGAPVPKVPGRKRQDKTIGLIVVGENGADRVAVAAPAPDPQITGKVSERIGPSAGLVLDDKDGNERGGFGVLDNDSRVVLGLDYPTSEAITLAVIPEEGASLQLKDSKSLVRAVLIERKDSAAKLYGVNWRDKAMLDVGVLRLSPYTTKQVVIKADEKAFTEVLDGMKP